MLNEDQTFYIETVVDQLVQDRKLFTARDITKKVRDKVDATHLRVRDEVNKLFMDGMMDEYSMTLVILNDNVETYLYHPTEISPYIYEGVTEIYKLSTEEQFEPLEQIIPQSNDSVGCSMSESKLDMALNKIEDFLYDVASKLENYSWLMTDFAAKFGDISKKLKTKL
jgi:hypothetical protein